MTARDVVAAVDGEDIVIRIRMPKTSPGPELAGAGDRLIKLERAACEAAGFELRALKQRVRSHELPAVKLGHSTYVRMSDLCALVSRPAPTAPSPSEVDQDYARLVASPRRRRRG